MSKILIRKPESCAHPLLSTTWIASVLCIFSQQTWAGEPIATSLAVNITVVGSLGSLGSPGSNEEDEAKTRVSQLLDFLSQDVSSHIPLPILNQVRAHPMTLILKEDIPMPEVFQASASDPSKLEIYLRPSVLMSDDAFQLLAHSYFHAVHYVIHPNEQTWIREGLAQIFEYMVLNRLNGSNVAASLQNPSTPLMGNYSLSQSDPPQYGHDLLYFYYLYRDCGGDALFWKIAAGEKGVYGADTLRSALENSSAGANPKDQCSSFENSVNDFEIAHALNHDSNSLQDRDRYKLLSTTLPVATPIESLTLSELKALQPYQPLVLANDTLIPLKGELSSIGIRQYWIEKAFPYSVQVTPPRPLNSAWILLLIRN